MALRQRATTTAGAVPAPVSLGRAYRQAIVVQLLNPKVALFFLAFLPQFIAADAPHQALAFVALGCLFNVNSLFVNVPVAWLASRAARGWRAGGRTVRWLQGTAGALFLLLAARVATLERS
jgi:threonine/homoserine/homoserine lactone efflux protein